MGVIPSSSSIAAAAAADSAQAQPEVLCKVDWSSRMNSSQVYTYDDGSSFEH